MDSALYPAMHIWWQNENTLGQGIKQAEVFANLISKCGTSATATARVAFKVGTLRHSNQLEPALYLCLSPSFILFRPLTLLHCLSSTCRPCDSISSWARVQAKIAFRSKVQPSSVYKCELWALCNVYKLGDRHRRCCRRSWLAGRLAAGQACTYTFTSLAIAIKLKQVIYAHALRASSRFTCSCRKGPLACMLLAARRWGWQSRQQRRQRPLWP